MIRLDRDGLEYLLTCCRDIGFDATSIMTSEDDAEPPKVSITFVQSRIAETPKKQPDSAPAPIEDDGEELLDGSILR
jgi:hypothetical protein